MPDNVLRRAFVKPYLLIIFLPYFCVVTFVDRQ